MPEKKRVELATILMDGDEGMTKEQLLAKIPEGLNDVKLYKVGKIELRLASEFLNDI